MLIIALRLIILQSNGKLVRGMAMKMILFPNLRRKPNIVLIKMVILR